MNYADERWLKVYTRDTGGWTMLSWQAKRGTRLPDGWTPSDETQAWARAIGHYPLRAVLPIWFNRCRDLQAMVGRLR